MLKRLHILLARSKACHENRLKKHTHCCQGKRSSIHIRYTEAAPAGVCDLGCSSGAKYKSDRILLVPCASLSHDRQLSHSARVVRLDNSVLLVSLCRGSWLLYGGLCTCRFCWSCGGRLDWYAHQPSVTGDAPGPCTAAASNNSGRFLMTSWHCHWIIKWIIDPPSLPPPPSCTFCASFEYNSLQYNTSAVHWAAVVLLQSIHYYIRALCKHNSITNVYANFRCSLCWGKQSYLRHMCYDKANDKVMLVKCNSGYFSLQAFKPLEHVYPARAQHSKVEVIAGPMGQDPGCRLDLSQEWTCTHQRYTWYTHYSGNCISSCLFPILFYSIPTNHATFPKFEILQLHVKNLDWVYWLTNKQVKT